MQSQLRAPLLPEKLTAQKTITLAACLILVFGQVRVSAQSVLPTGGSVTAGNAQIGTAQGDNLTITQPGGNAIINWDSFSVGQPNSVAFQNGAGATLNRVTGSTISQIDGSLTATGSLFLINENGLIVGPSGRIQTGGRFVGSTRDITNDDFLNGGANTLAGNGAGDILVQGSITSLNDDVVLIARSVANEGLLTAANGTVALGAGAEVYLQDTSTADGLMFVRMASVDAAVTHEGVINAASAELRSNGGNVYTLAGNRSGEVNATGSTAQDGRIFLTAEGGSVSVAASIDAARGVDGGGIEIAGDFVALGASIDASGVSGGSVTVTASVLSLAEPIKATGSTGAGGSVAIDVAGDVTAISSASIDVSGASGGSVRVVAGQNLTTSANVSAIGSSGTGGQIDMSGAAIRLLSPVIDASGATGGGTVRLGGEYQGGKDLTTDELPNARVLAATDATYVRADATGADGDGGTIVFWADDLATILANATARPGTVSGVGGLIEFSSGDQLQFAGTASAGRNGRKGTVLLDPKDIVVGEAITQSTFILGSGYTVAGFDGNVGGLVGSNAFGSAVSLDGTRLAVGARSNTGALNDQNPTGAVYLFTFSDEGFAGVALAGVIGVGYTGGNNVDMTAALAADDLFGISVSLDGSRLAVGAINDNGANNDNAQYGAVYLFSFDDQALTNGSHVATIGRNYVGSLDVNMSVRITDADQFGNGVSLDGTRLVVGALGDDGADDTMAVGAVHLFSFDDLAFANGTLVGTIGAGYVGSGDLNIGLGIGDGFGTSVSLDGDLLAVGANGDKGDSGALLAAGAVHLFTFDHGNTPFADATDVGVIGHGYSGSGDIDLTNEIGFASFFGSSVSVDGNHLAVGAPNAFGASSGDVAFLFTFTDPDFGSGSLTARLGAGFNGADDVDLTTQLAAGDLFGSAISLDNGRLAVGAIGDDGSSNAAPETGAVYLFTGLSALAGGGGGAAGAIGDFSADPGDTVTVSAATLAALLADDNSVFLKANNDIFFNATITVAAVQDIGNIEAQAGRSIFVNADITLPGGNVDLQANVSDLGLQTEHRDAGDATVRFADGVAINLGDSGLDVEIGSDRVVMAGQAGERTLTAGDIVFVGNNTVTANEFKLTIIKAYEQQNVPVADTNAIIFGAGTVLNLAGDGNDVVVASDVFTNNAGAGLFNLIDPNRRLVVSSNDYEAITKGGIVGNNFYNTPFVKGQRFKGPGNRFVFARQPTLTIAPEDVSREYGVANAAFTVGATGLVLGDSLDYAITGTLPTASTLATIGSDVGTYDISRSLAQIGSNVGYRVQFADGTLTVTPAGLTVVADAKSREYGLDNPVFTASFSGFRNGDTAATVLTGAAALSTQATAASNVGDYGIFASAGSLAANSGNYAFNFGNNLLSVTPASLTVAADAQSREYGLDNPVFTAGFSGFRNGDTAATVLSGAAALSTQATAASNVGDYGIFASAGSLAANNGNYVFDFGNNLLSVTPAGLTVTADDATKETGAVNPFFTASGTGFRNGDDFSVVSGLGFFSDGVAASPPGGYFIRPIGGAATNYTLTRVDGVLTVEAASGTGASVEDAGVIRVVETQSGGTSIASVFTTGTFSSSIFGGASEESTTGGTAGTGGVVIEIAVADAGTGSSGAFGFQLPLNFTGCSDAGACEGVPDSVFNANFVAAN